MTKIHWAAQAAGDFAIGANWIGGVAPGVGDDAILDAQGAKAYTVSSNASETVASIQTAATATLAIAKGTFEALNGTSGGASRGSISVAGGATFEVAGSVANTGTVSVDGAGKAAFLTVAADGATLRGGGAVTMSGLARIEGVSSSAKLTNLNDTISGVGLIGDGALALVNLTAGVIDADGATALTLETAGETLTNRGLIEATGVGGLTIASTTVNNAGGVISAGAGAHVSLQNADIQGGTLETTGSGVIRANLGSTTLDGTASTLVNQGVIGISNGVDVTIAGVIDNGGTIGVAGASAAMSLIVGAQGATLSGGGLVKLSPNANSIITGVATTATLTNADNTISGAGQLGAGSLVLINQAAGVINANGTVPLTINAPYQSSDPSLSVVNAGLIESTGSGGLVLENNVFANTGQIKILGAGGLTVSNAKVDDSKGGTLTLSGDQPLTLYNGDVYGGDLITRGAVSAESVDCILFTSTFSNGGVLDIDGVQKNTRLFVQNDVVNSGTISMLATGGRALLGLLDNTTLSGGGSVLMGDGGASLIASYNGNVLTNVNNTIAGSGTIGAFAGVQLNNDPAGIIASTGSIGLQVGFDGPSVNAGLIESTGAGGLSLVGYDRSILTNTGEISITGKGGLTLLGAAVDDTNGGKLTLAHGEALNLINAVILGGTLTNTAAGVVTAKYAGSSVETSTFINRGEVDVQSIGGGNFPGPGALNIQDSVVNAGTISVLGIPDAGAILAVLANTTLSGGGAILLSDVSGNIIDGAASTDTLTNVNDTISGSGDVGNGRMVLINKTAGVIDSTGTAGVILDTGSNTIANAGLIEATGTGGLEIKSALDNTGQIEARGGDITVDAAVTGKGSASVNGATLAFDAAFSQNVTFGATGALVLANSIAYGGNIRGFSTTGATSLDLRDIAFGSGITTTIKFNGNAAGGLLLVSDGTHIAGIALVGDYTNSTFTASSDGSGGTLIVDPAKAANFTTAMASFGASSPGSSQPSSVASAAKPVLATPATHSG